MRRTVAAAQAISPFPLITAARTSPARVESVPFSSASEMRIKIAAKPTARLFRLPTAQRTANAAEICRRVF